MKSTGCSAGPWIAGWNGGKTGPTCPSTAPVCGGKDWDCIPVGYGMEAVAIVVQQERRGDLTSNAHLIAAAPDLYEALDYVAGFEMPSGGKFRDHPAIRAALNKALGH